MDEPISCYLVNVIENIHNLLSESSSHDHEHTLKSIRLTQFFSFSSPFSLLGIILLSAIANRFRLNKLSRVDQFVMSYGGKYQAY